MERRSFLTWMQVGLLASALPVEVGGCVHHTYNRLESKPQPDGVKTVVFYVAPSGNDAWSGRRATPNAQSTDGPFATLQRARNAVRELKRHQGDTLKQPVTVLVRGGTYFLTEPLVFTPGDSGTADCRVTFAAYQDEKPVISGGRRIMNWREQDNLWIADLPEVKTGRWYFRLLRVGEHWAIRARYPKFEPQQPLTGGWLFAQWQGKPWERGLFDAAVGGNQNAGVRLEWRVNVPVAGEYRIWLRYAHNMKLYNLAAMDNRTTLRTAKGAPVPLRNLPDTGGWNNYRWVFTATLRLPAGEQSLIWENVQGGGLNLDALCLTDDSGWNPATAIRILNWWGEYQVQPPKEGKHLLVIQAEACEKAVGKEVTVPKPDLPGARDRIVVAPDKFPNWQNWDGAEVHIFPAWGWMNAIVNVERVDRDAHTLFVSCQQDIRSGNRFFIANVREALDSMGEWFVDRKSGELLYWPSERDFPNVEVVAPVMARLVVLQGDASTGKFVQNLHFKGLTFTDTDYKLDDYYVNADSAIWMHSVQQCIIENCVFQNLGGYAVGLEQRSHQNEIVGNTMTRLGGGGVVLLGDKESQPFDNSIAGNDIADCGLIYKHVAGVYITSGSGNHIAHNRIQRMPRYGISLKSEGVDHFSHNNIVEFNEIIDTNLETNDTGAIETLGRDKHNSGNIIRFNLIRNVVGMGTTRDGDFITPDYTWGIYLDDYSSGTTIHGNIVINTVVGAVCIHGGQDNVIQNNIFVNGLERQLTLQMIDQSMTGNIFRRNVVVFRNPNAVICNWVPTRRRDRLSEWDFNLYWHTGGLDLEKTELALTPEGNFAKWQAAGFDRNSIIANPLFANQEKGDFRLEPNSPVFKLGFKSIPVELIGLQGFRRAQKPSF